MKKIVLIAAALLLLSATTALAGDIMRYSPRTPAGGAYVPPTNLFEFALAIEKGSDGYTRRSYEEERYSVNTNYTYDANGNLVPTSRYEQTIIYDP